VRHVGFAPFRRYRVSEVCHRGGFLLAFCRIRKMPQRSIAASIENCSLSAHGPSAQVQPPKIAIVLMTDLMRGCSLQQN
jgi:hypothetical protein